MLDAHGRNPDGVLEAVEQFLRSHQSCEELTGDAGPATQRGYWFWITCSCGEAFECWVTPEAAKADLVQALLNGNR